MSRIDENAPNHCAEKKQGLVCGMEKKLFFYLFICTFTLISSIIILYLLFHPTVPHFSLKQAQINHLNVIPPSTLNSSFQLTLVSTNPNKRAEIYYDNLLLYASYKNQQITSETALPSFYQDVQETNYRDASLVGKEIHLDPYWAHQIQQDQATGKLALDFKVIGKFRLHTRTYPFTVNCATTFLLTRPTISTETRCSVKLLTL